jgi:hypothetical protein
MGTVRYAVQHYTRIRISRGGYYNIYYIILHCYCIVDPLRYSATTTYYYH